MEIMVIMIRKYLDEDGKNKKEYELSSIRRAKQREKDKAKERSKKNRRRNNREKDND